MKKLSTFKKKPLPLRYNINDLYNLYQILKKMQKKRPNFNIKWIMKGLVGSNYLEYIIDKKQNDN